MRPLVIASAIVSFWRETSGQSHHEDMIDHVGHSEELEFKVVQHILKGYNKDVRPTRSHMDVVTVTLGLALIQLVNLDEKNQILSTNCWLNQIWMDYKLAWDPSDFGNITTIMVPASEIWKPDVFLYNAADSAYYHGAISTNAILHHTGNVTWFVANIFRSTCAIDAKHFPFDQQTCTMKFGSWTYDLHKVDLALITSVGDTSNYVPSTEWSLVNMTAVRTTDIHPCCGTPYPFITITIIIRRLPLFYVFMYLMPCISLTCFSLLGFCLPCECGEKIFLGIKALLSLVLFVMTISELMPPSFASVPLITLCYAVSMFFISSTTAVQVWTLNLHYSGSRGRKVPSHIQKIFFHWMAPLLCVHYEATNGDENVASAEEKPCLLESPFPSANVLKESDASFPAGGLRCTDLRETSFDSLRSAAEGDTQPRSGLSSRYGARLDAFQNKIITTLDLLCYMIERSERRIVVRNDMNELAKDWQKVAAVMDRLSLITIIITMICAVLLIFFHYQYG